MKSDSMNKNEKTLVLKRINAVYASHRERSNNGESLMIVNPATGVHNC